MSIQKQETKPTGSGATRVGLAAALAVVAIASASAVHAADAGMIVVKDPVTGQLRAPTAEEFRALELQRASDEAAQAATRSAATAPAARSAANGAVGYRVGDAFLNYSVVTRNADGAMTTHCVTGADAAEKLVRDPQSSTARTDKEHRHAH